MEKFAEGQTVRNTETKVCAVVKCSFVRNGESWYEVLSMQTDTREEWRESEMQEENDVSY